MKYFQTKKIILNQPLSVPIGYLEKSFLEKASLELNDKLENLLFFKLHRRTRYTEISRRFRTI
jgi:hypothetical protein